MSELSVSLLQWEQSAFERGAKAAIDIEGDTVTVSGPSSTMRRIVDLALLNYVEVDGMIRTMIRDPIPHSSRQKVNALIKKMYGKKR
jgi:hypothetical protein